MQNQSATISSRKLVAEISGTVSRTIIDEHNLDIAITLPADTVEALLEILLYVVDRHDNRH